MKRNRLRLWGAWVRLFYICWLVAFSQIAAANYGFQTQSQFFFEDLKDLIEANDLRSIEDVLAKLKSTNPAFLENFVLVYNSKSLQRAHFLAPRVLLFDNSAQLVVTFNGDPQDKVGFQQLEVMQFRPQTDSFEFREISFTQNKSSAPSFSDANPAKCLQCHQSPNRETVDPRPNWEPYNIWPGIYGSNSGGLSPFSLHDQRHFKAQDKFFVDEQHQEASQLRKFFRFVKPLHPRYRFLGASHLSKRSAHSTEYNRFTKRTVELTDYLGHLNFRRVFRSLKFSNPLHYEYLKYSLAGLAKCNTLYLPESSINEARAELPDEFIARPMDYEKDSLETRLRRIESMLRFEEQLTESEIQEILKAESLKQSKKPVYPHVRFSEALLLLFEPLGIAVNDWSMDFQTEGRLAFNERFGLPSNPQSVARNAFMTTDKETFELTCQQLEKLSLQNFEKYKNSPLYFETLKLRQLKSAHVKPMIDRCINCHVVDSVYSSTPFIPFDNPNELKNWLSGVRGRLRFEDIIYRLSDHASLDDQMPRGLGRPSLKERSDFLETLRKIKDGP